MWLTKSAKKVQKTHSFQHFSTCQFCPSLFRPQDAEPFSQCSQPTSGDSHIDGCRHGGLPAVFGLGGNKEQKARRVFFWWLFLASEYGWIWEIDLAIEDGWIWEIDLGGGQHVFFWRGDIILVLQSFCWVKDTLSYTWSTMPIIQYVPIASVYGIFTYMWHVPYKINQMQVSTPYMDGMGYVYLGACHSTRFSLFADTCWMPVNYHHVWSRSL